MEAAESPDFTGIESDFLDLGPGWAASAPGHEAIQRFLVSFGLRVDGAVLLISDEAVQAEPGSFSLGRGSVVDALDPSDDLDIVMQQHETPKYLCSLWQGSNSA